MLSPEASMAQIFQQQKKMCTHIAFFTTTVFQLSRLIIQPATELWFHQIKPDIDVASFVDLCVVHEYLRNDSEDKDTDSDSDSPTASFTGEKEDVMPDFVGESLRSGYVSSTKGGSEHDNVSPAHITVVNSEQVEGATCSPLLVETTDGGKGIFKPLELEGRNADQSPLKRGVRLGDTAIKEVAAYSIGANFDVPSTHITTASINGKSSFGSFQKYVSHTCSAEDMGSSAFSTDEVQKIGILDVRLLNLDRHLNNLLVVQNNEGNKLIPIDHGYSLPSYHDLSDVYFGWTYFPQCKKTWTENSKKIVAAIDALKDAQKLQKHGVSADSIVSSVLSTILLQYCVANDVSLYKLAVFLQASQVDGENSLFEKAVQKAIGSLAHSTFDFADNSELPHQEWGSMIETFFRHVKETADW